MSSSVAEQRWISPADGGRTSTIVLVFEVHLHRLSFFLRKILFCISRKIHLESLAESLDRQDRGGVDVGPQVEDRGRRRGSWDTPSTFTTS